jgi:NADH:ubiquinone oxidoreductase subunit 2 (subunit N)
VTIGLLRYLLHDDTMVATTERLEHWDDQLGKIQSVVGIAQMLCRVLIAYRQGNTKRLLQHLSIAAVTIYLLVKQPEWQERWAEKYQ